MNQTNEAFELYHIYLILRKLNYNFTSKDGKNKSLFPIEFIIKLLNERLWMLNNFGEKLTKNLFKRLNTKKSNVQQIVLNNEIDNPYTTRCLELDEYFHYSLYYLHDFVIELNWHDPDLYDDTLEKNNAYKYVKKNLAFIEDFYLFKKKISTLNFSPNDLVNDQTKETVTRKSPERTVTLSPQQTIVTFDENEQSTTANSKRSIKTIKSSLSMGNSRIIDANARSSKVVQSPSRKKRIRFKDSSPEDLSNVMSRRKRDLRDSQSILALDILLYSMNLFVENVYKQLMLKSNDYLNDLKEYMNIIRDSRTKIRSRQLNSISIQIKKSNDIYLTVLEHFYDLRKIYLSDLLLTIMSAKDSPRLVRLYKKPHVKAFIENISGSIEKRVISNLVSQCSQLLSDLIVCELNIPPIELDNIYKGNNKKSRDNIIRSRENYLNFITSWLNVDDIVFGFLNPRKQQEQQSESNYINNNDRVATNSTLASAQRFKSSSRILSQMDNLNDLMKDLLTEISSRIQSKEQLKFFLELLHLNFEKLFDIITNQLLIQMSNVKEENRKQADVDEEANTDFENVNKSLNLITVKIRCLKLVHVISSLDKLINQKAAEKKIIDFLAENKSSLLSKIDQITNNLYN